MTRLSIVLLVAVLASALYLVHIQYESRRLFTELERSTSEAHRLDVERDRLQVEKRGQATPLRVEKLARDKLQMRSATPAITQYVPFPVGTEPSAAKPAAAPAATTAASAGASVAAPASANGVAGSAEVNRP